MKNNVNIVNKKVKFEYEFLDKYIAGVQLVGSELKPIRNNKVSLVDSYCFFENGELFLKNSTIQTNGTSYTHEPIRDRKLLLKKGELKRLNRDLKDGLTIVPFRMFINERNKVKVEIVLAKGRKLYDKKNYKKEQDILKNTFKNY